MNALLEPSTIAPGTVLKAISLDQPWASFIACGLKLNETRSRSWSYVGPIAIASTKRKVDFLAMADPDLPYLGIFLELCEKLGAPRTAGNALLLVLALPRGEVLCVADKTGCHRAEDMRDDLTDLEAVVGNYDDGRFAYSMTNVRVLPSGIRAVGAKQGIWNWTVPAGMTL